MGDEKEPSPEELKQSEDALKQLEERAGTCTAALDKKRAQHWAEVEQLVGELEKTVEKMKTVGENVKKLIRANHATMTKHEKQLAQLRKKA